MYKKHLLKRYWLISTKLSLPFLMTASLSDFDRHEQWITCLYSGRWGACSDLVQMECHCETSEQRDAARSTITIFSKNIEAENPERKATPPFCTSASNVGEENCSIACMNHLTLFWLSVVVDAVDVTCHAQQNVSLPCDSCNFW